MGIQAVREAYAARVREYVDAVGSMEDADVIDQKYVLAWSASLRGKVLDVGCGPGQWTNFLHGHGVDVEGVDPVPGFIADARSRYPNARYRMGRAEDLQTSDASLGGVLAWYSLIHTDPAEIHGPLAEFARCLMPGGGLALGFFVGANLAVFDHAIAPAYAWPVDQLCAEVERAGFEILETQSRPGPPGRTYGALIARRLG
ncbi:MAG: class I SAM-dependent methyltransferase [Propionibacteriaceae bacterium]|nr:SAM-dependent methyltransferase [Propionibacteriaceae bacterium]HBY22540.1 SAM-dependent methyltransferase [Propionibacteriaceae bacterium]